MSQNPHPMSPALTISKLNFAYETNSLWMLSDFSLSAYKGEIVSILGASGCGKTTLLNLIAGLLTPNSGTIDFNQDKETNIGYIFQQDALLPWRTIKANLCLAKDLNKSSQNHESTISKYLQTFHLSENILSNYPSQLSGGMRQRVSIIQSLLFNPQILLLDEPFSALDFYTKLHLEAEFHNLIKNEELTAILVTHDIDEAIAISDRILIMDKGGKLSDEYKIDLGKIHTPEESRGLPAFANYYNTIWSKLKAVVAQ